MKGKRRGRETRYALLLWVGRMGRERERERETQRPEYVRCQGEVLSPRPKLRHICIFAMLSSEPAPRTHSPPAAPPVGSIRCCARRGCTHISAASTQAAQAGSGEVCKRGWLGRAMHFPPTTTSIDAERGSCWSGASFRRGFRRRKRGTR